MAIGYRSHYLANNMPVLGWMEDAAVIVHPGLPSSSSALEAGTSQSSWLQVQPSKESDVTDPSARPVELSEPSAPQAGTSSYVLGDIQPLIQLVQSGKPIGNNTSSHQPMDVDIAAPENKPQPPEAELVQDSGIDDFAGRVSGLRPHGDS